MQKIKPDNLAVYVCSHVFEETRPVLYVCRADGDWQFLCGNDDHYGKPHVVGVGHLTARDPSLNQLAELKPDWGAEREEVGAEWVYCQCQSE